MNRMNRTNRMNRMNRRKFLAGAAAGAALAGPAGTPAQEKEKPLVYFEFRFFRLRQGEQVARFNKASAQIMALVEKHKLSPVGFFDTVIGSDSPSLVELLQWTSLAQREEASKEIFSDPDYRRIMTDLEPGTEPAFQKIDIFVARATPYSPVLSPSPAGQQPRLFELRVYRSPTFRQLEALHERFGGAEIKIFHRCGIHPVLYGSTTIGPDMPNLVYLTPFDSLAEREKAWAAFGADPEWRKVRAASIAKSGQIVGNSSITILRARPNSHIR